MPINKNRIWDYCLSHAFSISPREYFPAEIALLAPMIEDGLVTVDDCGMQVRNKGRLLIHRVCMVFDEYLKKARRKPAGENLASFCQMLAEK